MDIISEAVNLVRRYEKGDAFRQHVQSRMNLVAPLLVLCALISLALGTGVMALMEKAGFLAVVFLPIVLIGSALLQLYLVFSWLELRALRPMVAHGAAPAGGPSWLAQLRSRLGKAPPIPWIAVGVLLGLPWLLLVLMSFKIALLVVLLAVLAPVGYAYLDR